MLRALPAAAAALNSARAALNANKNTASFIHTLQTQAAHHAAISCVPPLPSASIA
jgi:hypothetical protein